MLLHSYLHQCHSPLFSIDATATATTTKRRFTNKPSHPNATTPLHSLDSLSSSTTNTNWQQQQPNTTTTNTRDSSCANASCSCGRRSLLIGTAAVTALVRDLHSNASDIQARSKDLLNSIHPQRPDWYEQFYALSMEKSMKPYEAEIAGYKSDLFTNLRGARREVLELGIGTGPNLKYYAGGSGVRVFGVDPNKSMEKYARAAATAAGLPLSHFNFTQAVGEALPINDASMDAVVGTLVLCSVTDVRMTLQEVKRVLKPGGLYIFIEHVAAEDRTALRLVQNVLDPLQQIVSDGCHLTRETGTYISQAGFSNVDINMIYLPSASLIGPHVYGIACK